MQLHEIYAYMEGKYAYFAMNVNKSWRNSVRHNLSLNECFIKAARGTNGKGNYWRIHPLCEREFMRGNFRRKTFKQLIRAGAHHHHHHHQQLHHHMQHAAAVYQGFTSLPLNYSSSISAMFPPPLPNNIASLASNTAANLKSEQHSHSNVQRYRPY